MLTTICKDHTNQSVADEAVRQPYYAGPHNPISPARNVIMENGRHLGHKNRAQFHIGAQKKELIK